MKFTENLKKVLNYLLDINLLIIILTFIIFGVTFFGSKGILFQHLYLSKEKKIIHQSIKIKEQEITKIKIKIKLLKERNKEVTEIESYKFKKKIPYEKYQIIKVD